jgi:ribulose-5-phosphate 4-epimerase/fuculose-1-phosphate aldolase
LGSKKLFDPTTTKMPSPIPPVFQQQLRLLVRANHILHQNGLVDAFGHISIRHPMDRKQYLIAAYDPGAPALVKSREDFIAYYVEDSRPVDPDAPQGYSERFIHGEIFKKFSDAKCVIHSHSEAVIPFTIGRHSIKPVFHMAGFLGADPCPIFKAADTYGKMSSYEPDMLIKNAQLGSALASKLSDDQPVVLQSKHGFTTYGKSIEQALYRAIYTQTNCKLLAQALATENLDWERVQFLSKEEAAACRVMNEKCQDKSFRLWLREVQVNPLYQNEEGEPEKLKVAGMKM